MGEDQLPVERANPGALIESAIRAGANVDVLERLLALQERWEAAEARRQFHEAMLAFKSDPPRVVKNRAVTIEGGASYLHATIDQVVDAVTPALARHGLSFRWEVGQCQSDRLTVRCIVSHRSGHSVATELSSAPDNSGRKNQIQATGSALTYLQRYTLLSALGLAAGLDDDGRGTSAPAEACISDEQAARLRELLQQCGPGEEELFLRWARVESLSDVLARNYQYCLGRIEARLRNKQRREQA